MRARWREIARPSPVPPNWRVVVVSSWRKGFENRLERLGRNADPRVRDGDRDHPPLDAILRPDVDGHRPVCGELDRVRQQVEHDLPQPPGICHQRRLDAGQRQAQIDALGVRLHAPQRNYFGDRRRRQVGRGGVEPDGTRIHLGEIEDIVDQRPHRPPRRIDQPDAVAEDAVDRVVGQHHLRHAENAVEWSANLVAGRGEELRLGLKRLAELDIALGEPRIGEDDLGSVAAHRPDIQKTGR